MREATTRYYRGLYEVSKKVISSLQVDEVLQSLVKGVTEAMGAKGCALMLLSPDGKVLVHRTAYGLSDTYIRKGPVDVDSSISEALEGKVIAIPNAPEDPRIEYPEEAKREGITSILCVPMVLGEKVIGVMRVYTQEQRHFSIDDMYFAGTAANLGAIAMENARFYESAKKSLDTLKQEILELATSLKP